MRYNFRTIDHWIQIMASLGAVLKEEITRLSRKEVRKQVEPIRKASATHRREIAALKRQLAQLQRQMKTLSRGGSKVEAATAEAKPTRFVAKGLRALRNRLGVSQIDFGKLAGVSGQSIYNWEGGKSVPRKAQLATLATLRTLGKREAQERLQQSKTKVAKKRKKRAAR
jgi:DNA-binding transcriptional regulator YiaG